MTGAGRPSAPPDIGILPVRLVERILGREVWPKSLLVAPMQVNLLLSCVRGCGGKSQAGSVAPDCHAMPLCIEKISRPTTATMTFCFPLFAKRESSR
jgi:hypothetical protein